MNDARRALVLLTLITLLAASAVSSADARSSDTAQDGSPPRLVIFEAFLRPT